MKTFNLVVPSENISEMLKRGSENIYLPVISKKGAEIVLPKTVAINVSNGVIQVPINWKVDGTTVSDKINIDSSEIEGVFIYSGVTYTKKYKIKLN